LFSNITKTANDNTFSLNLKKSDENNDKENEKTKESTPAQPLTGLFSNFQRDVTITPDNDIPAKIEQEKPVEKTSTNETVVTSSLFSAFGKTTENDSEKTGGLFSNIAPALKQNEQKEQENKVPTNSTAGGLFSNLETKTESKPIGTGLFSNIGPNNDLFSELNKPHVPKTEPLANSSVGGGLFSNLNKTSENNTLSTGLFNNTQVKNQDNSNSFMQETQPAPVSGNSFFDNFNNNNTSASIDKSPAGLFSQVNKTSTNIGLFEEVKAPGSNTAKTSVNPFLNFSPKNNGGVLDQHINNSMKSGNSIFADKGSN
jgi:hypothetical protein